CSSFVTSRGYPKQPASDDEFRFPIAYSLVVYKDFEQFEMLLRAVYQPQNIYCIHVDRKAQRQFQDKVGKLIKCFPNVYLTSKSYHVIWGRMGVIEADLICMRDLLIRHKTWKYFINLTGQEFPLKTNWEIVQQLKTSNNKSLVHALSAQESNKKWAHRVNTSYAFDDTGLFTPNGSKEPMPHNMTYHKGRLHVILTRAFVDYAINSPVAQDLLHWLNDTLIPDETFFPTLYCNRHLKIPGNEHADCSAANHQIVRLKIFNGGEYPCDGGKWVRKICIFGVGDLAFMYERGVKGPSLFVNKLMSGFQPLALQCMNKLHLERT
ncbi:hypothetical protein CAPTEDRAFT_43769, partial [Capitella teleta]